MATTTTTTTLIWYLLALVSVLSLLGQELSRSSALAAADFETNHHDPAPPPPPPKEEVEEEASLVSSSKPPIINYCDKDDFETNHHDPAPPPPKEEEASLVSSPPSSSKPPSSSTTTDYCDKDGAQNPNSNSEDKIVVLLRWITIIFVFNVILFIVSSVCFNMGKTENENIALGFAQQFAKILGGDGEDGKYALVLKESLTFFKYRFNLKPTSGGFCRQEGEGGGLLATLELQCRFALPARIFNWIFPCEDEITIEAYMDYDAMDNVVFALVRNKASAAKDMRQGNFDLHRHARYLITSTPPGTDRKSWVAEDLAVITESMEVARHLITDEVLDQVFGDEAFDKFGKGFISMHFSDMHPDSHRKKLVFKFSLPPDDAKKNMADHMKRLFGIVPYYIDLIGRYKMTTEDRSKIIIARMRETFGLYGSSMAEKTKMMKEEFEANNKLDK